jgi:hypothetical protein
MATNLVSEIAEVLTPSIISRIASSLGLGESSTQKAVGAAVPGLLAALLSLVSKPPGPTKLSEAVAKQQPAVLSNLANIIGEQGQRAWIDKGASTLTALLGSKTTSTLTSTLGNYAISEKAAQKSLMGLLGPARLRGRGGAGARQCIVGMA